MSAASVKDLAKEYGAEVSDLAANLAIEAFKDIRHYPNGTSTEDIEKDLDANINKIAMAAVEIDSKVGLEGQVAHSENGMVRTYTEGILSYKGVIGYAHII